MSYPGVPCGDPSGGERLERVGVAQQLPLLHLIQDVLAEHAGEAELAVAHQREHQVHQLFQDVLRQLHQAAGRSNNPGTFVSHLKCFSRFIKTKIDL